MTKEERENALHCLRAMVEEEVCEECELYGTTGTDHCEADCVRVAIEALKKDPRKGQWITNSDYPDTLICDNCGARFDMWKHERKFMHYCPNCGADMREGEE